MVIWVAFLARALFVLARKKEHLDKELVQEVEGVEVVKAVGSELDNKGLLFWIVVTGR